MQQIVINPADSSTIICQYLQFPLTFNPLDYYEEVEKETGMKIVHNKLTFPLLKRF